MILTRWFRKTDPSPSPAASPAPSGGDAHREPAQPAALALAEDPPPPASADEAISLFGEIQELIGPEAELLSLPADTLFRDLPEAARGPNWSPGELPGVRIELERDPVLEQMRRGRVAFAMADIARMFPSGWVRTDSEELFELPLPDLVEILPAELVHGADRVDDEVIAVAGIRDFFLPPADAAPEAGEAPAPPDAPAEPPAPAAAARAPGPAPWKKSAPLDGEVSGWDGVESRVDAGANSVELNRATAGELETLPGVGALRARWILEYRERNGPFRGVYDLLRVPGFGRKLFRQVTGLRPLRKNRRDRHERLNELLGLPAGDRPSLGRILQRGVEVLGATGGVLSGPDGMLLAQAGLDPRVSERYAVFTPNFFRKTRRYWPLLGEDNVQLVALPGAKPGALLTHGPGFAWILVFPPQGDWHGRIEAAARIGEEIHWLFSRRAVVRRVDLPGEER